MLRHLWWVVGLVLVCGGVAATLSPRAAPDDFGWFAYAPSSSGPDWSMTWNDVMVSGSVLVVSRWQLAASAVVALGLVVLAAGAGFQLGRRRGGPREQS